MGEATGHQIRDLKIPVREQGQNQILAAKGKYSISIGIKILFDFDVLTFEHQ